jgi:hypothetical protein
MRQLLQTAWRKTLIPYWWRRWRWGFDPRDLWSIDFAFFEWLKPRLARYRESPWCGTPIFPGYDPEVDEDYDAMRAEWGRILDEIEWFLDYMASEDGGWPVRGYTDDELYRRVMRGYGLLMKYLPAMWE